MEKPKRQTAKDLFTVGDWVVRENIRAAGKVTRVTASWVRVEGVVSYAGRLHESDITVNRLDEVRELRKTTQEEAESTGLRWLAEQAEEDRVAAEKRRRERAEYEEQTRRHHLADDVLGLVRAVLMEMTSEELLHWRRILTEGLMVNLAGRVRPGGDTPQ